MAKRTTKRASERAKRSKATKPAVSKYAQKRERQLTGNDETEAGDAPQPAEPAS